MKKTKCIAEWKIVSELVYQDKALSQSEIAQITGITQSSLPAIIIRLSLRNILKLTLRHGDKRVRDLFATTKAKKIKQEQFLKLFDSTSVVWAIYQRDHSLVGGIEIEQRGNQALILNLLMPDEQVDKNLFTALLRAMRIEASLVFFEDNTYIDS